MIFFDHIYTLDLRHRFYKRLEKMGFILDERRVAHPGGHRCRFIMLDKPASPLKRAYLEFIHIKPGGERILKPGISFGYTGGLEKLYGKFKKDGLYQCDFIHRNYRWKEGDRSRQPGWNYISFRGLGFRRVFPWMTEYEYAAWRNTEIPPKHPNGVIQHLGFELELNEKSVSFFSYLLKLKVGRKASLPCGTQLFITRSQRTRINAVVLKCKSLNRLISKFEPDDVIDFHGKPAAIIRNPSGMWDLIIV